MIDLVALSREETALYSIGHEIAALGCMLLSEKAAEELAFLLQPEDFYRPAHRLIFGAMLGLLSAKKPIDPLILNEELMARGELANVGGQEYINELDMFTPSAANSAAYAQTILDRSALRKADQSARRIVRLAGEGGDSAASSIMSEVKALVGAMEHVRVRDVEVDPRSLADRVLTRKKGGGAPTGFWSIDSLHCVQHGGLARGQYTLYQAATGRGKTTTMKSMAFPACERGERVIVATFADLTAENWQYFAHRYASGFGGTLEECQDDLDRRHLLDAVDRVHSWDWTIYEAGRSPGGRTIEAFRSWLMRDIDRNGPPSRVVMDYAQRIKTSDRTAMEHPTARNQHVSEATMDLAAAVPQAAFMVGCQVTPTGQDKSGKMQFHAKHATDWDENSALTFLCHRDEIDITKNRFGTDGVSFATRWDGGSLVVREAIN